MKKNDIIARENIVEAGTALAHNFISLEKAQQWINETGAKAKPQIDELNLGMFSAVATTSHISTVEAEVSWVVDDEVAIRFPDSTYKIINLKEEPEWKVIREAVPSYQSSVEHMSDDQLRESIDVLRTQRKPLDKPKRTVSSREPPIDKNDPVALMLAKMPEAEKLELKKKLGLVD